jgi:hypothetical protein
MIAVSASSARFYLCYTSLAAPPTAFVVLLCRSALRLLLGGIVYDYGIVAVGTIRCPLCYTTPAVAAIAAAPLPAISPPLLFFPTTVATNALTPSTSLVISTLTLCSRCCFVRPPFPCARQFRR